MIPLYQCLLYLYSPGYRQEYGAEMLAVFCEARVEMSKRGLLARFVFSLREIAGVLFGVLDDYLRSFVGSERWILFPTRRFVMRSEFRFPKTTPFLMALILLGIVVAAGMGAPIRASLPGVSPLYVSLQTGLVMALPMVAVVFVFACAAGGAGWLILHMLRRSGVHRLSELEIPAAQK